MRWVPSDLRLEEILSLWTWMPEALQENKFIWKINTKELYPSFLCKYYALLASLLLFTKRRINYHRLEYSIAVDSYKGWLDLNAIQRSFFNKLKFWFVFHSHRCCVRKTEVPRSCQVTFEVPENLKKQEKCFTEYSVFAEQNSTKLEVLSST